MKRYWVLKFLNQNFDSPDFLTLILNLSIKCNSVDAPKPREHFLSKSNFLLFQLEANRFDKKPRVGPIIRYTLRPAAYSAGK